MYGVVATEGASSLETVMNGLGDVFSLATKCFDYVIQNPILLFFFAAGLVPVGIGIFRSLKRAAKS